MAGDRGRDLKVSILSDADRFDLAHPADELENLGTKAKDAGGKLTDLGDDTRTAGSDLGRLGTDATDAGSKVDRLGDDVKDAGKKIADLGDDTTAAGDDVDKLAADTRDAAAKMDASFDTIARASTKSASKIGTDAHQAGQDVGAMGDEIKMEGVSAAGSFDGSMSSVLDSAQALAGALVQSLGPVAAGVGIAAAAGVGILRANAEKAKEAVSELVGQLIDQGGELDRSNVLDTLKTFAQDGTLVDLKRQAEDAKIPVNDFLLAMAGDPDAIGRSTESIGALGAKLDETRPKVQSVSGEWLAANDSFYAVSASLLPVKENYDAAAEAAGLYASTTGTADDAVVAFAETIVGWGDSLGAYTDKLAEKEAAEQVTAEATAAATTDATDSWEDYAKDVKVSISEYLTELLGQVTAQEDWAANMTTLAGRVSTGTLAELGRMGPEGAPLVAKLATASDAELGKLEGLLKRRAASGVDGFAAGLDDGADDAAAAAGRVRDKVGDVFHRPIKVKLELDSALFYTDLGRAKANAQAIATERMRP